MKTAYMLAATLFLGACATHAPDHNHDEVPVETAFESLPPGSNFRLRSPITISDDLEVIISDVIIPANGTVPRHFHPGEEFLYLIEGSAIHVEEGKADQLLKAGDAYVIPPQAIHSPRGGPKGARAIVFRVHKDGEPERVLVEDSD